MQALLDAPDPSTRMGVRDRAILHLAVCAGLRVSELTGLRTDDVAPQSASIRVRGKGRRERALPLWKTTAAALRVWLAIRGSITSPELFVNARRTPFSRWGVAYLVRRHTETADRKCLTLRGKQVSPHVLRHTCAMIVLQATKDIRKVSLWLGHSDLTTTEVYVRADPTEKLEAIEAVAPPSLRKGKFRPPHFACTIAGITMMKIASMTACISMQLGRLRRHRYNPVNTAPTRAGMMSVADMP
jgi:integrase/recombinase XerD